MWDIPRDPIGCIQSAAMLYVVPVATIMETIHLVATLRVTNGTIRHTANQRLALNCTRTPGCSPQASAHSVRQAKS
eukprot:6195964-Pleurochrysis_carterae.AAC.1